MKITYLTFFSAILNTLKWTQAWNPEKINNKV